MRKKIIIETISFLFIILFVYAAVIKLLDVEKFRAQIGQSPLLTAYATEVSWMVPIAEILISVALVIPQLKLIGLYAAFGMMIMFTAYIVAILNFSEHIPCSCGGVLEKLGWTEHLFFNIGFALLAVVGVLLHINLENSYKNEPITT